MSLEGRRIVVPESRALDLFVSMLERQGAIAIRCPMVAIFDIEDEEPVLQWLRRLSTDAFDDVVFFTGEGVTRLLAFADRHGMRDAVLAALGRVRKIVRGPKPVAALRRAGLRPDLSPASPTTEGLIETLALHTVNGRRIGIQAYPGMGPALVDFLVGRGAQCDTVFWYRYASHEEDRQVLEIIRLMIRGEADLIAFTSTAQVRRLQKVADAAGMKAPLDAALRSMLIGVIGPVTADAVRAAGWDPAIEPPHSYHLKPFVAEIARVLRDSCSARKDHSC